MFSSLILATVVYITVVYMVATVVSMVATQSALPPTINTSTVVDLIV